MHPQALPSIRRYTVDVPDGGGPASHVRWGDTHPNLLGWDVAYRTTPGSNNAQIVGIWECIEHWYQQASVDYGDQTVGTLLNQGGRVFLPYATISLLLYGQNGIGNATVEILATPVMCGETPLGKPYLYGIKSFQAEASSSANITVAKNANMFAVARGELTSTPWEVEAIGGASNRVYWAWQVATGDTSAGLVTELPWRTCPPEDASTQGTIKITNEDDGNTASGQVWFRFDFTQGR